MDAMIENEPSKTVLYYVEQYLPSSQAFIAQQARSLGRYTPEFLVGEMIDSSSRSIWTPRAHVIEKSASMKAAELLLKTARLPLLGLMPCIRQANILHAHFGKNGYVLWPLARTSNIPLVTTFHGFDATYNGDPRAPGGFNQVRYFRRGRAEMAAGDLWSIAVSDFVRDRLLDLGFPASRVIRHYIGIDVSLFSPNRLPRRRGLVVSIARFVDYKGHRLMIDALSRVASQGIHVEFVMVGQGPLRNEIETLAKRKLPKVVVYDELSQFQIRDLLSEAEIYLHGSIALDNGHAEAFGLANLEAQAVGTPVVAFRSGGVGEAVEDGRTGLLAAEHDTVAMSDAIGRLLSQKSLWQSFNARAPIMVAERFNIRRQTAYLEDYYDEVLSHANVCLGQVNA